MTFMTNVTTVAPVPVIGLEVHLQLATRTKIFCACRHEFDAPPNTLTCPVCLGLPGTLPVLNESAVELALRLGVALGCDVRPRSRFARKIYFYPDLPRNYQITQHAEPLCKGGTLAVGPFGARREIRLDRLHLEEDAGRSRHGADGTLIDLNRAGVPLAELVTRPDLRSGEEAYLFLREMRRLVRALGVCDGDLERGSLRCDANVSLRKAPDEPTGERVELKNLNSLRGVRRAVEAEIIRQSALLADGRVVRAETRGWNARAGATVFQRTKEASSDYRYFNEPDLPVLVVADAALDVARETLPELPASREARYVADFGLTPETAAVLCETIDRTRYFEAVVAAHAEAGAAADWICVEILRICGETGSDLADFPVPPDETAALLRLLADDEVSRPAAKTAFGVMTRDGTGAVETVDREGLRLLGDRGELAAVVTRVLDAHPEQVAQWWGGRAGVVGWLIGRVMASTDGRADPRLASELVLEDLARRGP